MSYDVYTVESLGNPNHEAIYIETTPDAPPQSHSGSLYHVTGTILNGMIYDPRPTEDPELLPEHVPGSKRKIAVIRSEALDRFERECCLAIPPPKPQVRLNGARLDPGKPLYRCGEWLRDVMDLAFEKGIFENAPEK